MHSYQAQGIEPAAAEKLIASDIQAYFHTFSRPGSQSLRGAAPRVGQNWLKNRYCAQWKKAVVWIEGRLRRTVPERTLYAFALHISSNLERHPPRDKPAAIAAYFLHYSKSRWKVRLRLKRYAFCQKNWGITLPQADIGFLSLLLRPDEANAAPHIGIIVLAHGRGIASGMVEVAQALTGMDLAIAIDMALDQDPSEVQEALLHHAGVWAFSTKECCCSQIWVHWKLWG